MCHVPRVSPPTPSSRDGHRGGRTLQPLGACPRTPRSQLGRARPGGPRGHCSAAPFFFFCFSGEVVLSVWGSRVDRFELQRSRRGELCSPPGGLGGRRWPVQPGAAHRTTRQLGGPALDGAGPWGRQPSASPEPGSGVGKGRTGFGSVALCRLRRGVRGVRLQVYISAQVHIHSRDTFLKGQTNGPLGPCAPCSPSGGAWPAGACGFLSSLDLPTQGFCLGGRLVPQLHSFPVGFQSLSSCSRVQSGDHLLRGQAGLCLTWASSEGRGYLPGVPGPSPVLPLGL